MRRGERDGIMRMFFFFLKKKIEWRFSEIGRTAFFEDERTFFFCKKQIMLNRGGLRDETLASLVVGLQRRTWRVVEFRIVSRSVDTSLHLREMQSKL